MKYLLLFLLIPFTLQAQETQLPEKYLTVTLTAGPRTLDTQTGDIYASFIDDSFLPDTFTTYTPLKDSYTRAGIQIGVHWGKYKGISHSLVLDFAQSENKTNHFAYSIGYSIPVPMGDHHLIIRPNIAGILGNTKLYLGEIQNTSSYLQINDLLYYEEYIELNLTATNALYAPQLDLYYKLHQRYAITLQIGYDIGTQISKPKLQFIQPSDYDEQTPTTKPINTDNPLIRFNDQPLTKLPYQLNGPRISLGASLYLR